MTAKLEHKSTAMDDDADADATRPMGKESQLSISWPEAVRGVPNAVLRGALFTVNQEREVYRKRQRIATVDGYEIKVKGERFNQRDLDLWEMLLHLGRQQSGKYVQFSASELLRSLDRGVGGSDYEELKEDIARLTSTYVEIKCEHMGEPFTFAGTLVAKIVRQETTQRYAVYFDEDILKLFGAGYSHVDWEMRRKLKGNALAQWLDGFYSTHATPMAYKVATLKTLCGSKAERLTDFRKALRAALKKMQTVGSVTFQEVNPDTDLVKVRRKPSSSQLRHLARKQIAQNDKDFSANGQLDFNGD